VAEEVEGKLWYGHVDMNTGAKLQSWSGCLDAFFPSVLALSGNLERAQKFQESCYFMWMKNGITPEIYNYKTGQVVWGHYFLRPDIIESTYYLYHYTQDEKYLKMGLKFLKNLQQNCRSEEGYTELNDVQTKEKYDMMQGFFFSETLKYLYLLFAPENTLTFDKVVFNTEGHPFRKTGK